MWIQVGQPTQTHKPNQKMYMHIKKSKCEKNSILYLVKPGKARTLSIEDEVFITLMKLRLNLIEDDIALRFNISRFCVSQILSDYKDY